MKISRDGKYRILKSNSDQPRSWRERPRKTHASANHCESLMQLFVPEVIERLEESKLAHNVEAKPAITLVCSDGIWSMLCNNSLKLVSISLDLPLI